MALDKLVDSSQLDADLASVAAAIRTKGGTSAQLAFPDDFVSAVQAIETGGGAAPALISKNITDNGTYNASSDNADGYSSVTVNVQGSGDYVANDWLDAAKPVGEVFSGVAFGDYATPLIRNRTGITKLTLPNATGLSEYFAAYCSSLVEISAPKVATIYNYALRNTKIGYAVFPKVKTVRQQCFINNTSLLAADFGGTPGSGFAQTNTFSGCTNLATLVLRASSVWPLTNVNNFSNTPFASGNAGGILYVPQDLIASYQAAANWSTILGYGDGAQNQILPIEGSIYETQYVDGTAIPTT